LDYAERMSPLGNASAESCADYCVVMFSDLTRMVTMQNLFHDGGFSFTGVSQEVLHTWNSTNLFEKDLPRRLMRHRLVKWMTFSSKTVIKQKKWSRSLQVNFSQKYRNTRRLVYFIRQCGFIWLFKSQPTWRETYPTNAMKTKYKKFALDTGQRSSKPKKMHNYFFHKIRFLTTFFPLFTLHKFPF